MLEPRPRVGRSSTSKLTLASLRTLPERMRIGVSSSAGGRTAALRGADGLMRAGVISSAGVSTVDLGGEVCDEEMEGSERDRSKPVEE
jgi:hypothetical protein